MESFSISMFTKSEFIGSINHHLSPLNDDFQTMPLKVWLARVLTKPTRKTVHLNPTTKPFTPGIAI